MDSHSLDHVSMYDFVKDIAGVHVDYATTLPSSIYWVTSLHILIKLIRLDPHFTNPYSWSIPAFPSADQSYPQISFSDKFPTTDLDSP